MAKRIPPVKKYISVAIRWSNDQSYQLVKAAAAASGFTLSAYIRHAAIKASLSKHGGV